MAHVFITVNINWEDDVVSVSARRKERSAGEPVLFTKGKRPKVVIEAAFTVARAVGWKLDDTFEVIENYIDHL